MTQRIHNPDTDADRQLKSCLDHAALTSFIMIAGAGSGKTTSLVKALAHIEKTRGAELRRQHRKIACITYTEIAANEIWSDVSNDPLFHVSTIHSYLWTLIKPFQADIKLWVSERINEKLSDLREKASSFGPRTKQHTKEKNERDILRYDEQGRQLNSVARFTYGTGSDYANGILGHDDIIKMVPALIHDRPLLKTLVAQKYPFVFIDESQDTNPSIVEAFKAIDAHMGGQFCLGFFGDPMQKIYATGMGEINLEADWVKIIKPENFRCPQRVLAAINNIRKNGDGLEQTRGRMEKIEGKDKPVEGTVRVFILPADESRSEHIQRVREWLSKENADPLWLSDSKEADVKVLVLVHRSAARRLGFPDLYAALNDDAPSSFKDGLLDGTTWVLQPFLSFLLPLTKAYEDSQHFNVMNLLRANCPLLSTEKLKNTDPARLLATLEQHVAKLSDLMSAEGNASILDVLRFVKNAELISFDDRFLDHLTEAEATSGAAAKDDAADDSEVSETVRAIKAYFACPAKQLWGYRTYVEDESPYWTQQGIKGAEFERVLTVLDDEESSHNQFSYEKFFGLAPLSPTDEKNIKENKDTVIGRTRRLLYVCCSRATKDLAIVFFTADVDGAVNRIKESKIFDPACIYTLDDMLPVKSAA
jgi:DNA helicase-2/ATP-dependent DNA helicase PcrA